MKILYGVPGEGMGHATRSKVIISHLIEKHDVRIVSSNRAFDFLNKNFPGKVLKIEGFHLAYKEGRVSKFKTFSETLAKAPKSLMVNFNQYLEMIKQFSPDLVISDFESFSYYFAKFHNLPIINIDNMQVIDRCKLDIKIPAEEKNNYLLTKNIIKLKVPDCNEYLITTFFRPSIIKKNTSFVAPILRDEIINAKTYHGDHILVYQTSTSQGNLISELKQLPKENFRVYGFNKDQKIDNVQLCLFSEKEFIHDLATSKAVLSNGGFSLISEAVYLKKPVCSYPIQNQFEQFVNAAYIEYLGYGKRLNSIRADEIKSFLYDLKMYQENINNYQQAGNTETFFSLDEVLKQPF